jgi:hypothetical protein
MSAEALARARLRISWMLFVTALLSYGWFINGVGGPNPLSRIALTLSLLEQRTVTVDRWVALFPTTFADKSQVGEHYYSDKAPGVSLLALPAVWLGDHLWRDLAAPRLGAKACDLGPPTARGCEASRVFVLTWIAGIATSALAMALAVVLLFRLALRLTGEPQGAVFAALALGFATPAFGWATAFFGHATSAALLLAAMVAIVGCTAPGLSRRSACWGGLGAGLALGAAVAVEYTALPASLALGLFALWRLRALPGDVAMPVIGCAVLGGLAALLPVLIYNAAAFGSPFRPGYADVVGFEGMSDGLFGIGAPSPGVLVELLFGRFRGLLWVAPVLVLVPLAAATWWRRGFAGDALAVCLAVFACFLLVNAGYVYWEGGDSTGPRHLTPALPFLCLTLASLWGVLSRPWRIVAAGLLGLSAMLSLACTAVDMTAPEIYRAPLTELILPGFLNGQAPKAVLGAAGFGAIAALLPLLLLWLVAMVVVVRELSRLSRN